ncbi:MAG: Flp pilus assembly complex ATPase component TadA [Candidatus Omnitrophica bacterium]|nr:Flp pilus assembly complex ATPase component TadA [Candidatus Omnitrophota bacterium]
MPKSFRDRLSEYLIKNKLITEEGLARALEIQKRKPQRLSSILLELGFIKEKDVLTTLSQALEIPPVEISKMKIQPDVIGLIPKEVAFKFEMVPIAKIGKMLTICMADPLDVFAVDDIRSLTGYEIRLVLATGEQIRSAIERFYGKPAKETLDDIIKTEEPKLKDVSHEAMVEEKFDKLSLLKLAQENSVIKITNYILTEGVNLKSSDILIEPEENYMRVRYRIDGIYREAKERPAKALHSGVVSRVKVLSDLDIAERRRPQDGRLRMDISGREVEFRVSSVPSNFGEKLAIRILDTQEVNLDIERLGFEADELDKLKKAVLRPYGMLLVCGPTGSGKTTTLYSILKFVDSPAKNIVTVEDPVEYEMAGINQVTVNSDIGLTFAASLRSILRQDPNVILIGEIRDYETCDIAIKAALTGHLVLSTLHTTSSVGSIIRLINMGIEPFLISSSIVGIVSQRLCRKLCHKCREPYKASESIKEGLGIKDKGDVTFYKAKGCSSCFNTGYSGRDGIGEVLLLDNVMKNMINEKTKEHELQRVARERGMATLRDNGLKKAFAGITSLEEVMRVTVGE